MKNITRALIFFLLIILTPLMVLADGTGGNISYDGFYVIHSFYNNGSFIWSGDNENVSLLIIAGGGAGGGIGGGGGAGGLIYFDNNYSISAGNYSVIVGSGGIGALSASYSGNGSNSSFGNISSMGGGAGANNDIVSVGSGGSGGGGSAAKLVGGSGIDGQGYSGGLASSVSPYKIGGGGGAGSQGYNYSAGSGEGGYGMNISITGNVVCYAGGGGGGARGDLGGISGAGRCGGGNGTNNNDAGGNGTNGLGGGGGGGGRSASPGGRGGNGGSGIIIIRYLNPSSSLFASFVSPTPNNNSHNNTQVNISIDCSNNTGTTYYIWFDNVDASTPVLINSTSKSWITNATTQGIYYYKGGCYREGAWGTNTSIRNWYYDTSEPVITINTSNNEFNNLNYSIQNQYDNNLNISLILTDNIQLYAFEINITDESGNIKYNFTNTSLTGTSVLYKNNLNVTNWGAGLYNIKLSLSDTHTATAISEYAVSSDDKNIIFNTAEGNDIKISGLESTQATYEKKIDRYEFGFTYDKELETTSRVYYVETIKGKIKHIKDSPYKAHFVIFDDETFNGNWVDFEGLEGEPIIYCESEKRCSVTFNNVKEGVVLFKSIGGLNIVHNYYSWYRGNYTTSDSSVLAGDLVTLGLNISNHTSMSLINISLNHNGNNYNSDYINNASYDDYTYYYMIIDSPVSNTTIYYNWSLVDLQNDENSTTLTINDNYTTSFWNISLCSATYNYTTLKFNMFYEQIPTDIFNMSLELQIKLWAGNESQNKNLSFNLTGNNEYYICLYANQTLKMDLYAKDSVIGGFTHRYFLYNATINSNQRNISLYNFNDTTSTALLRITARDSDTYQYYPEIVAWLERLYVGEGVWRVVQMDKSDDYGLLIYDVVEKSQDYRLKFYDTSNNLLKTSDTLRFSCDSGVCELVSLISPTGSTTTEPILEVSQSYNNVTKILNVVWNEDNDEVTSVRIYITKETLTGSTTLFNVTQNGSSGSYNFNLTGITGMVLLSVYKTASPESDAFSEWINLATSKFSEVLGDREGAWWGFVILVVVVMLGIISPIACIIMAVVGMIALYSLGLFSGLTLVVVIVAGVMAIALGIKIRR